MRRLKSVVTILALCLLVGVSLAATIHVARQGLPEPDVADRLVDRRKLLDFLTATDLRHQPEVVQAKLMRRLEDDLRHDEDWSADLERVPEASQKLFADNLAWLLRLWFLGKVEQFHSLPEDRRNRFVDRQLNTVMRWPRMPAGQGASGKPRRGHRLETAMASLQASGQGLDERQQTQARQFVSALQQRFIARTMGGF